MQSLGKVFLIGYYGCGNLGDEWLLSIMEKKLQKNNTPYKILSGKKRKPSHIPRVNLWKVFWAIKKSDTVVFGGGSILQNESSNRSLWYYLALIWLAKKLKKKIILVGQGIGPIRGEVMPRITAKLLSQCDKITVRDDESAKWAKERGIRVIESADLVFQTLPEHKLQRIEQTGEIVLNLTEWEKNAPKGWEKIKENALRKVKTILKMSKEDGLGLEDFEQLFLPENPCDSIPKSVSIVICCRYHVAVWAILQGIPFLVIDKNTKSRTLARACAQEWISEKDSTMTVEDLDEKIKRMKDNWAFYKKNVEDAREELFQKSQLNTSGWLS